MTGTALFTVSLDHDSGLSQDVVVNTWHFDYQGISPVDPDNVFDMLVDFYTTTPTGGSAAVGDWLGSLLAGTATVRAYDLADPSPRAPIFMDDFTFTPALTTLPQEVALCLSYKASIGSGDIAARRRGRVYIGPLSDGASVSSTGRPAANIIADLAAAAGDLLDASNAAVNWKWVVFSPTADDSNNVVGGWVDNEFDTQRRRGLGATSRTNWS